MKEHELIDTTGWSSADIKAGLEELITAHAAAEAREQAATQSRRVAVAEAISNLEALLGPATGEPGVDNIRAVRRFDDQTLADNAGLALNLAFHALEMVTENALNMARVIAADN